MKKSNVDPKNWKKWWSLCQECGKEVDPELKAGKTGKLCIPCFHGLKQEPSKVEQDFLENDLRIVTKSSKKSKLIPGVNRIEVRGEVVYRVKIRELTFQYSVSVEGSETIARNKAINLRKKLNELKDPFLIKTYVENLRRTKKSGAKKDNSLPQGIGFSSPSGDNPERYTANYRKKNAVIHREFPITKYGKRNAFILAVLTRKAFLNLDHPLKIRKWLSTELPKLKKKYYDRGLPKYTIKTYTGKDSSIPYYSVVKVVKGVSYKCEVSSKTIGEDLAFELASLASKKFSSCFTIEDHRQFATKTFPRLKKFFYNKAKKETCPVGVSFVDAKACPLYMSTRELGGEKLSITFALSYYGKKRAKELATQARKLFLKASSYKELENIQLGIKHYRSELKSNPKLSLFDVVDPLKDYGDRRKKLPIYVSKVVTGSKMSYKAYKVSKKIQGTQYRFYINENFFSAENGLALATLCSTRLKDIKTQEEMVNFLKKELPDLKDEYRLQNKKSERYKHFVSKTTETNKTFFYRRVINKKRFSISFNASAYGEERAKNLAQEFCLIGNQCNTLAQLNRLRNKLNKHRKKLVTDKSSTLEDILR